MFWKLFFIWMGVQIPLGLLVGRFIYVGKGEYEAPIWETNEQIEAVAKVAYAPDERWMDELLAGMGASAKAQLN